ncbi:MAG: ctc [Verrucomicrobia bacterium]|jgi:large subunit ribosomal protein L25|nr:ctc [Verrucomicrobiota bacterium]
MKSVSLTAYPRTLSGRLDVKKLRAQGRVPAVIYGGQAKPESLELTQVELENLIHHSVSENVLVDLKVEGGKSGSRLALLQDVQHYALTGKVLHVDFHEVFATEKVTIMVPVETKGEASGVKNSGGVLQHVLHKVKVKALPKDLPEIIEVDVTKMELNQTIHLGELPKIEGVEYVGDVKLSVISVSAPRTEKEEEAAPAAAPGDVVAIKEKKTDEAAAAPAAGAKGAAAAPAKKEGGDKGKK